MASIGDVWMRLLIEDQSFQADAKKAGAKGGEAAGKSFSGQFKSGFEGVKLGAGMAAFNLMTDVASGAVDALFDSVDAASALNETVSKGRVIFGDNADQIEAWADRAARAFGQSKKEAIDTASGFAGLFSTVGLGADESAEKAQRLTELGSDLASFFDTDMQTALDSLKSGLAGESEPLRKFNVFLSETAVTAKLTEMGIKKVGGQFTEAQKATARYALILEQTESAQGDFGRTSDSMANQQRSLNAELANTSAEVGQKLIPVFLEFQRVILTTLDRTSVELDTLQEATRKSSDAARFHLSSLQHVADELGISIEQAWEQSNAAGTQAVDVIRRNMMNASDAMDRGERDMATIAKAMGKDLSDPIQAGHDDAVAIAAQTPGDLADALRAGRTDWQSELSQFRADFENRLNPLSEIAQIEGLLAGEELAAGLRSSDPVLRTEAEELRRKLKERLSTLGDIAYQEGRRAAAELARGLQYGADGLFFDLRMNVKKNRDAAEFMAGGGKARAGMPYIVGEKRPELFVPGETGTILPHLALAGAGLGAHGHDIYMDREKVGEAVTPTVSRVLAFDSNR